jgi:hypothetical protein
MLPSQQLKQERAEAVKIAKESLEPRAKEAKKSDAPAVVGREMDLTGGLDVKELRFPANVMMANGGSSLAVGNHYSNSMGISGKVERIVLMPAGYCLVSVPSESVLRWVVVMPTGMTAELP